MNEVKKKFSVLRDYWPQLTFAVAALLFFGRMYSDFGTLKVELLESQRLQQTQWKAFNDKIEKTIAILNDEDDGVRGDFMVGDAHLQENIDNQAKIEEMRSEKDKLEIKVWYYEHAKK